MTCDHCGKEIVQSTFAALGFWEPDIDPSDDPIVWRHKGTGYAACSGSVHFAKPTEV